MTTLTEGPHPGGFLVWEVLRDYTRETTTIASGAGKLAPGTVLGKITTGGKYTGLAPAATNGSQNAAGILWAAIDATDADAASVVILRGPEAPEISTIFLGSAGFQAHGDVFLIETFRQIADGGRVALGSPISCGILAILDCGDDRNRPGACLIAGKYSAGPEAHASWSSPRAILHHEAFTPAGHYAHPEAGDAFIPDEELHHLRFDASMVRLVSFGMVDPAQ